MGRLVVFMMIYLTGVTGIHTSTMAFSWNQETFPATGTVSSTEHVRQSCGQSHATIRPSETLLRFVLPPDLGDSSVFVVLPSLWSFNQEQQHGICVYSTALSYARLLKDKFFVPRSFPSHYQTPSLILYEVRVHGERDTYSDYIECVSYSNLPLIIGRER